MIFTCATCPNYKHKEVRDGVIVGTDCPFRTCLPPEEFGCNRHPAIKDYVVISEFPTIDGIPSINNWVMPVQMIDDLNPANRSPSPTRQCISLDTKRVELRPGDRVIVFRPIG
jgi:hypothetical protein